MKILYITNGINGAGGLERVLSVKASYLADQYGYDVIIATLNEEYHHPFYPFSASVHFETFGAGGSGLSYVLNYCKAVKQLVREVQPDVISVCDDGLKGFFIPRIIGKKFTVIYERHASVMLNDSAVSHQIMKWLARDFQKLVVLTKGNLQEWPAGNLQVIPNPVSFYPGGSSSLENKRIIAVGSHSYNKGYDRLLEVWKKTADLYPDWSLEIYGKSSGNHEYENLAASMKLKNISFYAPVDNIQEKYQEADIFVLPSRSEGFGMVLIEAMACGLPVVSFDCPHGPADIITTGQDGFLVENGNIEEFADRLQRLMNDGELRKKMGRAGREQVKKYLPEVVMKEWDALFRNLVKKENPSLLPRP
ncbi:glycosyltransferase family 4 protein [Chryseobacterium koreense]|uniref:Glycosyl transferase family 1 domain-containing protein n=1 Tax=Chryseobacterium koreense CCUG 49689 TaxID=1304281 RepID=A0A0J7IWT9_9FLAO|nr:glycosyltransferase family 4 protein [Chryseobacterium koreense]KMQ70427.1 hypothetical protein ACM44_12375 [Chryseobacterium koreense CCUG 49689]MBB5333540.1 glycosyltransferase involved in cell wall biosynthesis [Chryseobacterium koreense]